MKPHIFIHGIMPRSGTNFLNQLILLHPQCKEPSKRIRENWLLYYSNPLYEYINSLNNKWLHPTWIGSDFNVAELKHKIGATFIDFLSEEIDTKNSLLVSKTPKVENIHRFFELFPKDKLLIIIRDPKDVVASTYKSWGIDSSSVIKEWNKAANIIQNFEKNSDSNSYILLRYEDLIANSSNYLNQLLEFCELDKSQFPWDEVNKLPIFGSSEGDKWKVKEKNISFKPIGRWVSLPKAQLRMLELDYNDKLAEYFGYKGLEEGYNDLPTKDERLKLNYQTNSLVIERDKSIKERIRYLKKGFKSIIKAFK